MLLWPARHCWISRCTFLKHIQLGRTIPWFRSRIRYISVVYPYPCIWCVLDNVNFIVTFIYLFKYGVLRQSIKWLGPKNIQHSPPLKQSKQTKKVAKKAKTWQSFAVPNKNFLPLIFYHKRTLDDFCVYLVRLRKDQKGLKMDQKWLRNSVFEPRIPIFWRSLGVHQNCTTIFVELGGTPAHPPLRKKSAN